MPLPIRTALLFLTQTIFTLAIVTLILRAALQLSKAHTRNVITQAIIKLTRPVIKPLQKILPTLGRFDLAVVVLCFAFELIKVFVEGFLKLGVLLPIPAVLLFSCGQLLQFVVHLYTIMIVLQSVLSWINPSPNAISDILYTLTTPLLNLVRRVLPPIGGLDLSPIPVLLGLQLLNILVAGPLMGFSLAMM
jgi:YggT family protein